jgi:hypothetical protein
MIEAGLVTKGETRVGSTTNLQRYRRNICPPCHRDRRFVGLYFAPLPHGISNDSLWIRDRMAFGMDSETEADNGRYQMRRKSAARRLKAHGEHFKFSLLTASNFDLCELRNRLDRVKRGLEGGWVLSRDLTWRRATRGERSSAFEVDWSVGTVTAAGPHPVGAGSYSTIE